MKGAEHQSFSTLLVVGELLNAFYEQTNNTWSARLATPV